MDGNCNRLRQKMRVNRSEEEKTQEEEWDKTTEKETGNKVRMNTRNKPLVQERIVDMNKLKVLLEAKLRTHKEGSREITVSQELKERRFFQESFFIPVKGRCWWCLWWSWGRRSASGRYISSNSNFFLGWYYCRRAGKCATFLRRNIVRVRRVLSIAWFTQLLRLREWRRSRDWFVTFIRFFP